MGLFESKDSKSKKSHFKNLVAIALADGRLDAAESQLLAQVGARLGIKPKEIKAILAKPSKVKFVPPEDNLGKISQMVDLVGMMMVDGNIDQREMQLCTALASGFGLNPNVVPAMVMKILEGLKKGAGKQQVSQELTNFFNQ